MAFTLVVQPGSVIENSGNIWKTEGGATFATGDVGKLRDGRDSTFARNVSGSSSVLRLGMDDPTIYSHQRIRAVRVWVRQRTTVQAAYYLFDGTHTYSSGLVYAPASSNVITVVGKEMKRDKNSAEWTSAAINALQVAALGGGFLNEIRLVEALMAVLVQDRPDAQVRVVTSTDGRTGLNPKFTWSSVYGGDDSDLMRRFQLKLFSVAVAEGGGFDPATSTALYDSGTVDSSVRSHTLEDYELAFGTTYYVSVRFATDFNGSRWWGNWATARRFTTHLVTTTTVQATAPTVTWTLKPWIAWEVTDPNGDELGGWEVKIFNAAQYGAPGFDPSTSTPVQQDSGTATFVPLWIPTEPLANNTTYRAYVRTTSARYQVTSPWAYWQFNLAVPQPTPPSVVAMNDLGNARIEGSFVTNANLMTQSGSIASNVLGWESVANATASIEFIFGVPILRLVAPAAGNMQVRSMADHDIPVLPNQAYSWMLEFSRVTGSDRVVRADIQWLDASKAVISTVQGSSGSSFGGVPVQRGGSATSPANAAYARLVGNVTSAAINEVFRIHVAMLRLGTVTLPQMTADKGAGMWPIRNVVQGSDDGVTWRDIISTEDLLFSWHDEYPTLNREMQYRALTYSSATGSEVESVSSVATSTLPIGKVWLKPKEDPSLRFSFPVQDDWFQVTRRVAREVHLGLGDSKPRIIYGEANYDEFKLSVLVIGWNARNRLEDLVNARGPISVMTPKETRSAAISGDVEYEEWLWDDLRQEDEDVWKAVIPFVEVSH